MWRTVLVLWSVSRLATLSLGVALTATLGWHKLLAPWQDQPWQALTGWDSVYYITISHLGYEPGRTLAFFPLYPAMIWLVREATGAGDALAALAVANLALLPALAGLYVIARDRLSEQHARRAVLYLLLSPYAFALAMAYTEGLFLALAVWAFVLVDRRRDAWAVPLAFGAGLARVSGLALVAPLAWIAWKRRSPATALAAAAPVLAFAVHAAWLEHTVGDPLGMVHAQRLWGGEPAFPLETLYTQFRLFAEHLDPFPLARGLTVVGYLALLVPLLRLKRFAAYRTPDTLYVLGIFVMPLASSLLTSVGRFGLVAFPLFLVLSDIGIRRESVHQAVLVFAPVLQIIIFATVALGYEPP
jgi:hypothetical protein